MKVTLPDGKELELADGATGADAAASIGPGLAKAALAVKVDGTTQDLAQPLPDGAVLEILTDRSGEDALELIRHDTAHVLAAAMMELYPGVKISIGPAIENGFYYDFDFPEGAQFTDADFERVEAKMKEHVAADEAFVREVVSVPDALERFRAQGQDYKVELIEDLVKNEGVDTVSFYTNGPFTDLCRGPHAPTTKRIGAFKLQSVAGAYWRGDSERPDAHPRLRHRLLQAEGARRLPAHAGGGTGARPPPFGQGPRTVHVLRASAGHAALAAAGHDDLERADRPVAHREPQARLLRGQDADPLGRRAVQGQRPLAELPRQHVLHRHRGPADGPQAHELPGPRASSSRTCAAPTASCRSASASRASSTATSPAARCTASCASATSPRTTPTSSAPRSRSRTRSSAAWTSASTSTGCSASSPSWSCRTRPAKRLGSDETWDHAEQALENALKRQGLEYEINAGDGAFYGPKIDLHMRDSLGRSWQLGTVQLDYQMPEHFDATYIGSDNGLHRPVMIHRALLGSFERFIGILIEHYAGEFPLWLTPAQAIVLTIANRHEDAARTATEALRAAGLRVKLDDRTESVNRKIREAELAKIPYMLIVGDREAETGTVSVRRHRGGNEGTFTVEEFVARIEAEVAAERNAEPVLSPQV